MKKRLLLQLYTIGLLAGCASSLPHPNLELLHDYSGGQTLGDATRLYWYTEYQNRPVKASDYVLLGDYGHYQTSYRWEDGQVREVVREGMQLKDNALVPYRVHLRFNQQGEAIYQQFRLEGKVLPLNQQQWREYQQQAQGLSELSKAQASQHITLFQGVWRDQTLTSCSAQSFSQVTFEASVPEWIQSRLNDEHFLVLLGKKTRNQLQVQDVLMMTDSQHGCIEQPELIGDE
ncbi:DUF1481 domain-containing protein [Vibrio sp. V27_P1S3P104]|uniref:DUF1481 domain-containing protein n=1 Tax=unclassified Vibrio TaxID=2614977 RepID=UPI0013732F97|nr:MULTISPECIES: DUF1481 domain-containing protein [unclassified Vibrio]NAW69716.1 DUF1481 domain-containing protein [Vibrio sp. V28_P6S34P95]NAX06281.1 DUF1481 domain-containing protein [Vibrio sp. V30_P3S12P165]NAX34880.1 DUF1481 domain-containing protein [Vibrio sp. V29_P1S30P107]NAX37898.1 DUF1481 domain-containing protein [Vibrio sp. V27_P1S3P104]NAX40884.1 DUF1481 domain-containing protein [Vibrio sp. V26_P1S5P106]